MCCRDQHLHVEFVPWSWVRPVWSTSQWSSHPHPCERTLQATPAAPADPSSSETSSPPASESGETCCSDTHHHKKASQTLHHHKHCTMVETEQMQYPQKTRWKKVCSKYFNNTSYKTLQVEVRNATTLVKRRQNGHKKVLVCAERQKKLVVVPHSHSVCPSNRPTLSVSCQSLA